jgi:hypothetical protein
VDLILTKGIPSEIYFASVLTISGVVYDDWETQCSVLVVLDNGLVPLEVMTGLSSGNSFEMAIPVPGAGIHVVALIAENSAGIQSSWQNFTFTAQPRSPLPSSSPSPPKGSEPLGLEVIVPGEFSIFDLVGWDNGIRIGTTRRDEGWRVSFSSDSSSSNEESIVNGNICPFGAS